MGRDKKTALAVHLTYRNVDKEPVADYLYGLGEYTQIMKNDQMKMISDVEDLVYEATKGLPRNEWPDEVWGRFSKLKHKLLDKANEIARQPDNLTTAEVSDDGQHIV